MAAHITLYHTRRACSMVAKALLTELNIPFATVLMRSRPDGPGYEAADGSLSHKDYLDIHPDGYVPALAVEHQGVITELPAILAYIAGLAPHKQLLGDDAWQNAQVLSRMTWLSGSLHGRGFGAVFRPRRYVDDEALQGHVREKGKEFVKSCLSRINNWMVGRDYPLGTHETVLDYYAVLFWYWGLELGFDLKEWFPAYAGLVERMEKKAALREVLDESGIQLSFSSQILPS